MSALPRQPGLHLEAMSEADLPEVAAAELRAYTHPWTAGNFADSLHAGYSCRTLRADGRLVGYFIVMFAYDEAHLLNLTVCVEQHRRGYGTGLLHDAMRVAREGGAQSLLLEVRPSNMAARELYRKFGFSRIAVRRGYYPALAGREDALVLRRAL